nr:cyanophycinase [Gemmatimonadota bacterium]
MTTSQIRRRRGILLASSCALALTSCGGLRSVPILEAGGPSGHLFIVGGGPRPAEMMRQFVQLAGGPGRARILVFPQASGDASTGASLVAEFRALGVADARSAPLTRPQAEAEGGARLLEGITGVWFAGGDQSRLTSAIGGTPVETAIHQRYRDGAAIGGTSAGAAVMSAMMITGDERRLGGDRPPRDSSEAYLTIDRSNIVTARGFGLLPRTIVDQHFVRRKRHNRLMSLVLENPDMLGVGIDEATALQVNPDGRWTVVGASVVVVYDARGARITPSGVLGATGLRLHILSPGSVYDPRTGVATLGAFGLPARPQPALLRTGKEAARALSRDLAC